MHSGRDFILEPNLVLYLPLYELDGSTFMSKDAYGHTSTVTGALWRPNGRYFDSIDDYIIIPNHTSLQVASGQGVTQFAWVKPADNSTRCITSFRTNGVSGCYINMFYNANDLLITLGNNDRSSTLSQSTGIGIYANQWYFVAFTRSQTGTVLGFVNSKSATLGSQTGPMTNQDIDFYIGNHYYSSASHQIFNGLIGLLGQFNRCLTPEELLEIYLDTKWRYQ